MERTPIQSNSSILRPRARIIKTIGEELISNDIIAIIELVKNSYDANASIIEIEFNGEVVEIQEGKTLKKLLKKGGTLTISDDGTGMDLEIVKTAWMEPATINKKNKKSLKGSSRRFTGEKGIGRFASAKLANQLHMITRPSNDNEICVDFNWSDFADDDKYLDQVQCNWQVRNPMQIKQSGTVLDLIDLSSEWDETKLTELRVALSRLINPVSPITDFLIDIKLPNELDNYSGIISAPETLNKPDYYVKGHVSNDGVPSIKFYSKSIGIEEELNIKDSDFLLRDPIRKPVVGPFDFEFRVWNRDLDSMKKLALEIGSKTKNIKSDLDDLAGISLYRDQFRVAPYGNKNDDWLRLDFRRVNNPTMRLSNNQIVGYVSVSLDSNPDLKDQSNREGIVDSQAFEDLKETIKLILNQLEQKRYQERPREEEKGSQQTLFSAFTIEPISKIISTKLPNDREVKDVILETEKSIKNGLTKIQEVLSRYRRLSILGQLIDVILHDGNNFLARIDSENYLLLKEVSKKEFDLEKVKNHIKNINEQRKVMSQLFKRIEPFGGRKRGRPKDIIAEESINNVLALYKTDLDRLGIVYEPLTSKNQVRIDEGELQMIFVNLVQNSIYWLETVTNKRIIEVNVSRTKDNELEIIFSDSGPGISEQNAQLIFDPYFSSRPDGVGLGLTIVGELVTEYNGDFCLINNGPQDGATFKITFRYRV